MHLVVNSIFVRAFLITLFVCHAVQMCTYEIAVLNRAMPTDMIVVISRHVHCVTKNVRCRGMLCGSTEPGVRRCSAFKPIDVVPGKLCDLVV